MIKNLISLLFIIITVHNFNHTKYKKESIYCIDKICTV